MKAVLLLAGLVWPLAGARYGYTDDLGQFRIGRLPAGRYHLRINPYALKNRDACYANAVYPAGGAAANQPLVVSAGQELGGVTVCLSNPEGVTVQGRVNVPSGLRVPPGFSPQPSLESARQRDRRRPEPRRGGPPHALAAGPAHSAIGRDGRLGRRWGVIARLGETELPGGEFAFDGAATPLRVDLAPTTASLGVQVFDAGGRGAWDAVIHVEAANPALRIKAGGATDQNGNYAALLPPFPLAKAAPCWNNDPKG